MGEVGVGGKSDVNASCDAEVPWKHVERLHMLLHPWILCVGRLCWRDLQSLVIFRVSLCMFGDLRCGTDVPSCEVCGFSVRVCSIRPDLSPRSGVFDVLHTSMSSPFSSR